MANKMVANIKSLSEGVTGLTKHVNELYAALAKVNIVASKTLKDAKGAVNAVGGTANLTKAANRPGTGADGAMFSEATPATGINRMATSLAKFSQTPGGMAAIGGVQAGLSIAAGAYAAVPDVSLTMQRSVGYYQAGLKAPGINRNQLERATFGAMGGGLSSTGSDAIVAATLAGRGYTPGSKNYLQAAGEVGGAYKYLGIENAAATQAIAGMHSGPMEANLFQYGITTSGPNGQDKTMGQIAKELMNYMGASGASTEQVRSSYQKGALGANLATMGFDAATQEMLYQSMIDISSGRNPDLSKAKPMAGNENTALTAAGRMASSQTSLMTKAEDSMIKGFENAADTVEAFNRALSNVVQPLGQLKGYVGGVGGTNAGAGINTAGAGIMGAVKNIVGGAMVAVGAGGAIETGGLTLPLIAGGLAIMNSGKKGGSTSGYGASFGVGNRGRSGGAAPVAGVAVTAGYGATDNSGVWASTNNTHTGNDYATPIGTPVTVAYGDGVVTQIDINADYGTSVLIDHADGTQTLYAHLSERSVKVGDTVKLGQRIGKSGDSGNAGGPHLHFEMRKGKNNPVDPNKYLSGGMGSGSTNDLLAMGYSTTIPLPSDVLGSSKASTSPSSTASNSTSSTSSTNNGTVAMGSKDQQSWATDFLTKTGKPVTDSNLKALTTWMNAEGKGWSTSLNRATYNPLNTTLDRPGAISFNAPGVKAYTSPEQGMEATIATLTGKSAEARGYTAIMNALTTGTSTQDVLKAIDNSAWRSGSVNKGGYNFPTKGGGSTGYGAAMPAPAPAPALQGNKTVNITLNIERASEQEAMRLVKLVKTHLENDKDLARIGNS